MRFGPVIVAAFVGTPAYGLSLGKSGQPEAGLSWRKIRHQLRAGNRTEIDSKMGKSTLALLGMVAPCAPCKTMKRYGESNDGGYVVCQELLETGTPPIASYSYGVHERDKWSQDIANAFHVPVYQYDCFNTGMTQCDGCDQHFFTECLTDQNATPTQKFKTLTEHLKRNGHLDAPDHSLIMKMDIEGAEWDFFTNEPHETLKKIKFLVVELHHFRQSQKHGDYLKALRNLQAAGFRVQHIHANNWGSYNINYEGTPYNIPEFLEVTFVPFDGACNGEPYPYTLPEDAPNKLSKKDLKPPLLPDPSGPL